jgi:urea carboxylase-associated protein 1
VTVTDLVESGHDPRDADYCCVIPAGEPWTGELHATDVLRIVDIDGHQTADVLFYNAHDHAERYSAQNTIRAQENIYPGSGTRLMSTLNRALLTITADTCGRHDTIGGACANESNMVRFSLDKRHMHTCRHNFLKALIGRGMSKRDITSNVGFFRNFPVSPEGVLTLMDGILKPGQYVELRAEMDVLAVISNCPQINMPLSDHEPAPLQVLIWRGTET